MEIYNIFYLIYKTCYTFPHKSAASDREGLGRWRYRGYLRRRVTAAWKIANVVLDGCKLTHAGVDLQVFENLGNGAGPLYALNSGPVSNGRLRTQKSRPRQVLACPKNTRIKSKNEIVKPILGRLNAPRLPNGQYQKLLQPELPDRSSSACQSLTTCSTAVAARGQAHTTRPRRVRL